MAGEKRLRNIAILLADGVGTRVLILAGLASPRLPDHEGHSNSQVIRPREGLAAMSAGSSAQAPRP
jgi:hypothetical protein